MRYFTRVLWSENTHELEKLSFIKDFHTKIFQKDEATELIKYLESNATGDNTSFHKVNIHSSFSQVTWGVLNVTEVGDTTIYMTELGPHTASSQVFYIVANQSNQTLIYYYVEENSRSFLTPIEFPYFILP